MEWISIDDKKPADDELVLFSTDHGVTVGSIDRDEYGYTYRLGNCCMSWDFNYNLGDIEVTHWMPLPEPPTEDIKAE